jgi:FkbM family methyltransferase
MRLWCNLVPLATSIIDIGAQGGVYSLSAAAIRSDVPIHAFEPNPDGFARLLVNLVANDFKNIHPHREAVGHEYGMVQFSWYPKWLGHISSGGSFRKITSPEHATLLMVIMTPLDKVMDSVDLGPNPLMKIDVEGAEEFVFQGMPNVLAQKPDIILECFEDESCQKLTALTQPLGYNYYVIDEVNGRIEQRDRLYPGTVENDTKNQLLSVRPPELLHALAS